MLYANKNFLVSVTKVEDDGEIHTPEFTVPVFKGNLIGTDQNGNQFVLTENHFLGNYTPVEKVKNKRNKHRETSEWLSIEEAYQQEWINQDVK